MAHKIDMVLDFQYGSTGKGLIAGWLAKRGDYDTAICAFATNAGHTYIDVARGIHAMTQQLPTAITSSSQAITAPSASRRVFAAGLMRTTSPRRKRAPGTADRTE